MTTINDLSFDLLINRMLERIDPKFDKRETSICYQSIAMVVPELLNVKSDLTLLEQEAFPDSCNYNNLIRFCKFRGIEPYPPSYGEVEAKFNIDVKIGSRFNCDLRNYTVATKLDGEHTYKLIAEEPGRIDNYGDLTPIEDIEGLKTATITSVIVDGREAEEVEHLRERYIQSLDYQAFGGNRADYKNKILSIENVGAVKLFRRKKATSSEVGNVEAVVVDSSFTGCDSGIVDLIQKKLYPSGTELGDGLGLAPIGHVVKITPVGKQSITVRTTITVKEATDDITEDLKTVIDDYFRDLALSFGDEVSDSIVRISQIENRILSISGVIDVEKTTLNGEEKNMLIDPRSIPVLAEVHYDRR